MSNDSLSLRDQAAQMLEDMSQRDIRQIAEYCIDHLDDEMEAGHLMDYAKMHKAWAINEYRKQTRRTSNA